jgi:hypothetical protein
LKTIGLSSLRQYRYLFSRFDDRDVRSSGQMPLTQSFKTPVPGSALATPLRLVLYFAAQESTAMFLGLSIFFVTITIVAPVRSDPCAAIAGAQFVTPAHTLACLKSFPFNETLRQTVLDTVSRVFDFYTFEDYYPNPSAPFPNTVDVRAELARIRYSSYAVSSCS